MPNVLDMSAALPDAPARPHRRLLVLSRILSYLAAAILVFEVLEALAGTVLGLFFGGHILMGANGMNVAFGRGGALPRLAPGQVRLSDLPHATQLIFAIGWPIGYLPALLGFDNLRRLFALYGRGIVFARDNARHIARIGIALIAYPFVDYFVDAGFWLAGGADRASWFHFAQLEAFVLGLIVVVIAQVMAFGHEIEQERDSFV